MKEELLKGLSEEQIGKIKECKNHEEILALAKSEGIELTEEQLEAVSGGGCSWDPDCPECGESWDVFSYGNRYNCEECGCWFLKDGTVQVHGKKYKGN